MPELRPLRADDAPAVLAFELANRAWFTVTISDRGDEYFEQFPDRHRAALAEQEAGECAFYLLVAEDGAILGRFNLYDLAGGAANLGYRVGQDFVGRGLATAAVRELCALAASEHGLHTLRAATSPTNVASQRVLLKSGFVPAGPSEIGLAFQRDVTTAVSA
ncbi:GNAT family N-acetyltransferase [Dactylosporangium sp. CS-047395]|uniref:GNAT family N-acetyltransferase n=1 Tax=Dactylosporangium sp. CS-047395 TaxID=3239936 RepID=UPI003D8E4C6D